MSSLFYRNYHRFRAFMHIWLLQAFLPVSLTFVLLQWFSNTFFPASLSSRPKSYTARTKSEVLTSSFISSLTVLGGGNDVTNADDNSKSTNNISISEQSPTTNTTTHNTSVSQNKKQFIVVLTGGKMSKTLHIIQSLRSYAMQNQSSVSVKIIVLEQQKFQYSASRYSSCIDAFEIITSPRYSPDAYQNDIVDACTRHQATHFLPIAAPVEATYDARVKERLEDDGVIVLHMTVELCEILDDKHAFGCFLRDTLKLTKGVPYTCRVDSNDAVRRYNRRFWQETAAGKLPRNMILKNLSYDPIHRLDLFQLPTSDESLDNYLKKVELDGNLITEDEPWQLQEFLSDGVEYAAMIVVRNNRLVTVTSCPSSASQLNYTHQEIPAIRTWLDGFLTALADSDGKYILNGQLCFDFILMREAVDGTEVVAYPIECNPRVHTQCSIYNSDDVLALLGELLLANYDSSHSESNNSNIQEKQDKLVSLLERDYPSGDIVSSSPSSHRNVYWFYNELFGVFPDSWLLKYNRSEEEIPWKRKDLSLMEEFLVFTSVVSTQMLWTSLLYLPAFFTAMIVSFPVWFVLITSYTVSSTLKNSLAMQSTQNQLSMCGHVKEMVYKLLIFLGRLADVTNSIEGDYWRHDPIPFVAKNHVQIVVRLMASMRTGVEWKKVDFAIGKVVEVGGD